MAKTSLLTLLVLITLVLLPAGSVAAADCTTAASPGDDVGAVAGRMGGGTLCLSAGRYQTFVIASSNVTVRGAGRGTTMVSTSADHSIVIIGAQNVTLTGMTVQGAGGVYVAKSGGVTINAIDVPNASIGVHIDQSSTAQLDDINVTGATDVGLLVRDQSHVTASNMRILDSKAVGVAVVANAGSLTLTDSEVGRAAGPGIFAGISGCADLGAGTLEVPSCFLANPSSFVASTHVSLQRVNVHDGPGTGLVFFPGVTAEVRDSGIGGWDLTGLFAWGSTVNVYGSTFDNDEEHAIEYRSYPDPRGPYLKQANGSVQDTQVRNTRPLGDGSLGGGFIAQAAQVSLARDRFEANTGIGVLWENGSSGDVTDTSILNNGHTGLCINNGNNVAVANPTITGNANDDVNACAR